ncbi:MAG: type II toxin-antitoxin system RelE/ParE family toxin [Magnetococcales bacterium]|nr:type II toxin-antitoxin system RelE/ParE family toxin [Magnetococcales bacterium]
MNTLDLREYVAEDGGVPFFDWLTAIKDGAARARIRIRLERVRLGNLGDHKALGDGVHELRFAFGPGYRVYFGRDGERVILLLGGGDKSSQERDIAQAKQWWRDYGRRSDG